LFFDSWLSRFIAVAKLENAATALTPESFAFSRAEAMSIDIIGITTGVINSNCSQEDTSKRISYNPDI